MLLAGCDTGHAGAGSCAIVLWRCGLACCVSASWGGLKEQALAGSSGGSLGQPVLTSIQLPGRSMHSDHLVPQEPEALLGRQAKLLEGVALLRVPATSHTLNKLSEGKRVTPGLVVCCTAAACRGEAQSPSMQVRWGCSARSSCLMLLLSMHIQELKISAGRLRLQDNLAGAAVDC